MSQRVLRGLGSAFVISLAGCVYIPTWDWPTPKCCQCTEDRWGDVVDWVNHQSTIDQPCHDPHYVKRGVYRVAANGIIATEPCEYEDPMVTPPPQELTPAPIPPDERSMHLKP